MLRLEPQPAKHIAEARVAEKMVCAKIELRLAAGIRDDDPFHAGGMHLPEKRVIGRARKLRQCLAMADDGQGDDAARIDGVTCPQHRDVVEIQKIERADAFHVADVCLLGLDVLRDERAEFPFANERDRLRPQTPIEEFRRRLGYGEEQEVVKHQHGKQLCRDAAPALADAVRAAGPRGRDLAN